MAQENEGVIPAPWVCVCVSVTLEMGLYFSIANKVALIMQLTVILKIIVYLTFAFGEFHYY